MTPASRKIAVILFNLGGPEGPAQVGPFLRSLFSDAAIIPLPALVRLPLADLITRLRLKAALVNYAVMGGGSPLLAETERQAAALEAVLAARLAPSEVKVFVAMRHSAPTSAETARLVEAFDADQHVLAPLYPQYSTTTTASSLEAWRKAYLGPVVGRAICCWHSNRGLIDAHAGIIRSTWEAAGRPAVRLLFSAHGLPVSVVRGGDPYQWQVEATCAEIATRLGGGWDWRICYQSRVGPMKWLKPSTPAAIEEAAADGLGVLIDPVAFVSEHVETLVELDRDYRRLADAVGAKPYLRAPAVGAAPEFIDGLADAVIAALGRRGVGPDGVACPAVFRRCGARSSSAASQ